PDCHGLIDHREVFSLIEASSAFPGAFAPVWLKRATEPGAGCGRPSPDSALFSDGGIFDNNPIDLAAGIYDETIWKNPRAPDTNALLLFIDPDRQSGRLGRAKLTAGKPAAATGGIAALLDLFAGAVPAARQYELQALGRLPARAHRAAVALSARVAGPVYHSRHARWSTRPRRRGPRAAAGALPARGGAVRQRPVPPWRPDRQCSLPGRLSHHVAAPCERYATPRGRPGGQSREDLRTRKLA